MSIIIPSAGEAAEARSGRRDGKRTLSGRKNQAGHGHFHFYVDCIPSQAYSRPNNFGNCWAGAEASEKTVFDLATSQVKVKSGTHLLILALAQNNHVLYRVPAATISFTVLPAR